MFQHVFSIFGKLFNQEGMNLFLKLENNSYAVCGWIAVGIALAIMLLYYYALNHPRLNKWWHWLIVLLLVGGINFATGYGITNSKFKTYCKLSDEGEEDDYDETLLENIYNTIDEDGDIRHLDRDYDEHYYEYDSDNKRLCDRGMGGQKAVVSRSLIMKFGLADAIISMLFFFIFSISLKWWSTSCRRTPF